MRPILIKRVQTTKILEDYGRLSHLPVMTQVPPFIATDTGKILRSCEVMIFSSINHDKKVLQTRLVNDTKLLAQSKRIVCMQHYCLGSLSDLYLKSTFKLTCQKHYVLVSHSLNERNTLLQILCRFFLVHNLYVKPIPCNQDRFNF